MVVACITSLHCGPYTGQQGKPAQHSMAEALSIRREANYQCPPIHKSSAQSQRIVPTLPLSGSQEAALQKVGTCKASRSKQGSTPCPRRC